MKRLLMMLAVALAFCQTTMAQRFTDNLDRGLVAVPIGAAGNSNSNLVSWRRLAHEYYNVTYNVYKNGTRVASNLETTTYNDANGAPISTQYQVAAVVNGVEQAKCEAVSPWTQYVYHLTDRCPTGYIDINLAAVYDRTGADVSSNYSPNDAEMADLDGDGQLEIIIKRLNTADASTAIDESRIYSPNSTQFVVIDAYDVNWQTGDASLMWRIDCGPNMVSMNSTEINIIAYDWDEDGQAEVVMRGADNMIVYGTDGRTQLYTIGDMSVNTRSVFNTTNAQYAWTRTGAEYLIYMNGKTGELYQQTDFPLKRLESGESNLKSAWGDDYGHRSSKYFLGAPFLNGRQASLFLARGIYTRHKMIAMDLNRSTHQWTERWRWNNNSRGSSWYGNGYHNYIIADVDEDGRDEIVYGSMVIDDNGKGLSTTGLGHGDAQHVSDMDPYRKGLEFFGCNEDNPGMNYRDATTSKIYVRKTAGGDDGRALMANFSNTYPGSQGRSASTGVFSSVSDKDISEYSGDSYITWSDLNFRIYWDGDLCSEILNSPGEAREAKIEKPGKGRLFTSSGCNMNNGSKNNPCFQGDIIGDWREEIVVRRGTGLRVYTSGMSTNYSQPSLWFDHQYRQAMVWQMMAYNQPPHLSYFLGEMENITIAPPPLTTRERTEVESGSSITTGHNGKHVLLCDASTVGIDNSGVSPEVITVNVNTIVAGNDNNNSIKTTEQSTQLGSGSEKGDITGSTRLVKQGNGLLKLTAREFSYSGPTDIWGGTLRFRGTLTNSDVWMNRHTSFFSGATIKKSLTMEYGATLYPTNSDVNDAAVASFGTTTIGTLNLHEGARIVFQLDPVNSQFDRVDIGTLNIRKRTGNAWEQHGPQYLKPVIEIRAVSALSGTTYELGSLNEIVGGTVNDIMLEGAGENSSLKFQNGKLILDISNESVTAPTVVGNGKIKTVTPGNSSLGNEVSVYYTTASSSNPQADGTKLQKEFVLMPNETTYYFYSVSSSGVFSSPVEVYFDGIITETYDFAAIANEKQASINASLSGNAIIQETSNASVYLANYGTYTLGNRFATSKSRRSDTTYQDWWIRYGISWNCLLTYTGNGNTYYLSVLSLRNGDRVTFYMSNGDLTLLSTNVNGISANSTLTSGTEYTISTTEETTHLDLSGVGQSTRITKVIIKTTAQEETMGEPTISIAAANGDERIVNIIAGRGSQGTEATETYYTLDGSDPTSETNGARKLYTEPFTINTTTTVKAVSYLVDQVSTVAEKRINAGEALTLMAPDFALAGYADGAYTVAINSNQSSLDAVPADITYYYTIDDGETMRSAENGMITVYGGSKLSAYASAEGYNESATAQITVPIMPVFREEWKIDFIGIASTSYMDDKLGDFYLLKDDHADAVVNQNFGVSSPEGNNRFFIHNGGLYAFYSGSRNIAVNANQGQYVRIALNGNVNSVSGMKPTGLNYGNCYIYQVETSGICTINVPRYTVILSVEVLTSLDNPTITKTITDAGWATFCSPYALDFSSPITNLTQAYYVTGVKANGTTLTLLPITGEVPAQTGILLQGNGDCKIPILSGSDASTNGNLLVGVLEETDVEESAVYVLMQEQSGIGFYRNNNKFTIGAQTAYLPADMIGAGARFYNFFDGGTTSFGASIINCENVNGERMYNLNGQRIAAPKKGVYIKEGRKIIIK